MTVLTHDLPYKITLVSTPSELDAVCKLRAEAYGKHIPEFGEKFLIPDDVDLMPSTAILVATDKLTGEAVGSARLRTNLMHPLQIEECVAIPSEIADHHIVEITRFCAKPGYGKDNPGIMQPSIAIMKAIYLWSLSKQVRHIIIGAREKMAMHYEFVGFTDLLEKNQMIPLSYTGGLEHRVLVLEVPTAERKYHEQNHLLYNFMITQMHPDIEI